MWPGRTEAVLEARDLRAHLHAQLGVEVRERLVHQERLRVAHDRAAHGHALPLAAGELRGLAVEVLCQVEHAARLLHALVDLLVGDLREPEREAHVLAHGHVRVERVVLEDHRDVAVLRLELVDHLVADPQLALRDLLEARDHAQGRRLPAARRADEDHELAIADLEVHVPDGLCAVGVPLGHSVEDDLSHISSSGRIYPLRPGLTPRLPVSSARGPGARPVRR
jgi:hypothetical protein